MRLRRPTFQVNTLVVKAAGAGAVQIACSLVRARTRVTDLVNVAERELRYARNVVISRDKSSLQLESLILAQSERWRQA